MRLAERDVLLVLAARLAAGGGAGLGRHVLRFSWGEVFGPADRRRARADVDVGATDGSGTDCWLAGLLLAGHGALRTLAGTRVGLGALTADGKATTVAQPW
ncbi:hypothetical protein GCM10025864_04620 [Luteimicrobium album]|uniref:Uncharacterized protein n=1 Tax=Luteimicrobium album TaxID=1054550 RepID=A0ABQ6HYF0_9MICO|nr:hypothetical protein GCM10025864_04620 [Luteimicrobium album]